MALVAVKASKVVGAGASVTFTGLTATAGNALIVSCAAYMAANSVGANSVTRTGDTFTVDAALAQSSAGLDRGGTMIHSAPNVGASATNLVVAVTGANGISAFALEVSGTPTSSIRDATSPAIATGSSTTATANSLTNATADAIFVQSVVMESSANPATVTKDAAYTVTVGATTMTETNGTANEVGGLAYRIVSSVAAQTPAYTITNAPWGTHIAVYKAAVTTQSITATGVPSAENLGTQAAMLVQDISPIADGSVGGWTTNLGGTTNLYATLDELVPSNTDYIISAGQATPDVVTVAFASANTPDAGPRTLNYRYGKDLAGGRRVDLTVELLQGVSVVQTWTHNNIPAGFTEVAQTVSGTITDYTALSLRFTSTQT